MHLASVGRKGFYTEARGDIRRVCLVIRPLVSALVPSLIYLLLSGTPQASTIVTPTPLSLLACTGWMVLLHGWMWAALACYEVVAKVIDATPRDVARTMVEPLAARRSD